MGKKSKRHGHGGHNKGKNNRQQDENSSNGGGSNSEGSKKCSHITKAIKLGVLQNHIPHMKIGQCSVCNEVPNKNTSICICLRCSKQGCDRYSNGKHGLSHYEDTPSHCITVNLSSLMVWCYSCDIEIPVAPNTDLQDCINLLLKALQSTGRQLQGNGLLPKVVLRDVTQDSEIMARHYHPQHKLVKGLVNLGNTCFFNAVMQNLCQTELLYLVMKFASQDDYMHTFTAPNKQLSELSVKVATPPGSLTMALKKLLIQMKNSDPGPLNPKHLFSEICKKSPRFRGYQQQDSQELLRCLLDSIKTEQLRRLKIGVLDAFGVNAEEGGTLKQLSEEKKDIVRDL
ncbi:predicted protein [Nematostella vectensis]|uniref:ubiquitinyl hydrolase 1 n=1 Tax=Nematostella vectensis TaxID=45351 RepID=A7SR12_NEMVE|nr:predicted protein [Nematostella vectensis]|eukprot:XP_001625980.1 predicted protein [Nematostella vectensis]